MMAKPNEHNFETDMTFEEIPHNRDKEGANQCKTNWILNVRNYVNKEFPLNADTMGGTIPALGLVSSLITSGLISQLIANGYVYYHDNTTLLVWTSFALALMCGIEVLWAFGGSSDPQFLLFWMIAKVLEFAASLSAAIVHNGPASLVVSIIQMIFLSLLLRIGYMKYCCIRNRNY